MILRVAIVVLIAIAHASFWFGVLFKAVIKNGAASVGHSDVITVNVLFGNLHHIALSSVIVSLPPLTTVMVFAGTAALLYLTFGMRTRGTARWVVVITNAATLLPLGLFGMMTAAAIVLNVAIWSGLHGESIYEDWFPAAAVGVLFIASLIIVITDVSREWSRAS